MEVRAQIVHSLSATLSSDSSLVKQATEALDRLSLLPQFPFSLLSVAIEGENQGQSIAAATYLKNFTRRNVDGNDKGSGSKVSKDFKDQLLRALLQAELAVLKILIEAFRIIVSYEVVKLNSWPELVPDLRSAIQNSNLFISGGQSQWNTTNALTVLHALLRPFQYFLDPKVAKEPVPILLELIAKEILVPLLEIFHQFVKKESRIDALQEMENAKILLLVCKCMYFSVRSHMPSALAPLLPSFCQDLISILGSLSFDCMIASDSEYLIRLKIGKRSLKIFCSLVTRHRKYSDKLMPDMINSALGIVKYSKSISKLDFLSERIVSLGFDVISHVLETGPGWRLVSPHFSSLLESAIFPALVMNEKDISEWEEDADEFIRKNLPSDLEEVSGWREDLFTARKSAINLLAVISMSKGPPLATLTDTSSASSKRKKSEKNKRNNHNRSIGELLVLPFLSKFYIPSDANRTEILNQYFGVLMGYGGLLDYLKEQESRYITTLVRTRILPLYKSVCLPYLIAPANWVLGELATCLPEDMSADVYSSLLKALTMQDIEDTSCYPVRASAAGAIMQLLENEYMPPDWLPLFQAIIGGIGNEDEDSSVLLQLLCSVVEAGDENVAVHIPYIVSSLVSVISKCIPASPGPWPQMVEKGFAALAVMGQSWENSLAEEVDQEESSDKWTSGRATISRAFSGLLQRAWLTPMHQLEGEASNPSCIDDASTLLRSIMLSVTDINVIKELKISELVVVWAGLIEDWHAWEESEDMSVFECIQEVVNLQKEYELKEFISGLMPSPPNPPVPARSIIEGIGAFLREAISQYPSATWRACSCVHLLLHVPSYSFETENVKQSLAVVFCGAAFSRFKEICSEPSSLWKPLLLAITSCYLCYPELVERILEKDEGGGFVKWLSSLKYVCSSSYEPGLTMESEIKLIVMALAKVLERLLEVGKPCGSLFQELFTSLLEASIQLKDTQQEEQDESEEDEEDEEAESGEDNDDDTEDDDDEDDSEDDEHEETEEEFLNRYAKAAVSLQDGTGIEEGDVEDQDHEVELGSLEGIDTERVVLSLMERHHQVLRGQAVSTELVSRFVAAFPESNILFQQSMSN